MSDTYEAPFTWPAGPSEVIITGTFDNWSRSRKLLKSDSGFSIALPVKYGEKVVYKYIVDGQWTTSYKEPTERDPMGNVNNWFKAPEKPASSPSVDLAPAEPLSATKSSPSEPKPISVPEVAKAALATEGTSNPITYVASAVGAAVQQIVGIDPFNSAKLPVDPMNTTAPVANDSADKIPLTPAGAVEETAHSPESAPEFPSLVPAANGAAKKDEEAPLTPVATETKAEPPVLLPETSIEPPKPAETPKIEEPAEPEPTKHEPLPVETSVPEPKVTSKPAAETVTAAPVTPATTQVTAPAPTTNGAPNVVSQPARPSTPPPSSTRSPPPGPINVPSPAEHIAFPPSSPAKSHTSSLRKNGSTPRKKRHSFLDKVKAIFHSPTKEKEKLESK